MRISHRYKFVFLANPRTASTTVSKILRPYSDVRGVHIDDATESAPFLTHMPARRVKRLFKERGWKWFTYRRFCVVRNPYDRVVSLYHRHLEFVRFKEERKASAAGQVPLAPKFDTSLPSFTTFVREVLPGMKIALSLAELTHGADGRPLVDTVLRFENLFHELPEFLQSMGIHIDAKDFSRLRLSARRKPYAEYYDAESRRLVKQRYQYEIEEFGYDYKRSLWRCWP